MRALARDWGRKKNQVWLTPALGERRRSLTREPSHLELQVQ